MSKLKIEDIMSKGINRGKAWVYERLKEGKKPNIEYGEDGVIIVTDVNLTTEDTSNWDWSKIKGVIVTQGTKRGHAAIITKQNGVPAARVSSIDGIKNGDEIAINTFSFEPEKLGVYTDISNEESEMLNKEEKLWEIRKKNLEKYKNKDTETKNTETKDGRKIMVSANISSSLDAKKATENGAEGYGVVRTEVFYGEFGKEHHDELPNEDVLCKEYTKIANSNNGEIFVRTIDASPDKIIPAFKKLGIQVEEENSAMGLRGIRPFISGNKEAEKVFRTQIRAILRANGESQNGNLKIMIPMVTEIDEIRTVKRFVEEEKAKLEKEGKKYKECPVGIMVETPDIAMVADKLAKECDFVSIGSNDLGSYSSAADRQNENVEHLNDEYNLGFIRLLKNIIKGVHGGEKSILCGMCGEIASDPEYIPLLIGMGLDEFSMSASSIPEARRIITHVKQIECIQLLNRVLKLTTSKEIREEVRKFNRELEARISREEMENSKEELVEKKRQWKTVKEWAVEYFNKRREIMGEGERQ